MYHFNQSSFIRPYSIDSSLDSFSNKIATLSDAVALEVLAYYRGECSTDWIVSIGRRALGCWDEPKCKMKRRMTFYCTDGMYESTIDISTLCRHYELISDLYDIDNNVREVKLPFTKKEVRGCMMFGGIGINTDTTVPIPLACLKFLLPKRMENYLYYKWNKEDMDESFLRFIGRGLEKETRMHLSRLARIFPDDELYPIVDWAVRTRQWDMLSFLLKDKAPSVLLWCLYLARNYDGLVQLIKECNFVDKVMVVKPDRFTDIWGLGRAEFVRGEAMCMACWKCLHTTTDVGEYEKLLALFGIVHELLGNQYIQQPFGESNAFSDYKLTGIALDGLMKIDPSFTTEHKERIMSTNLESID